MKRKGHSKLSRWSRHIMANTKGRYMVYVGGNGGTTKIFNGKGSRSGLLKEVSDTIKSTPLPWLFEIYVMCRSQIGEEYLSIETLSAPHSATHDQLCESIGEAHMKMLEACNGQHVLNIGYIGSPRGEEIPPELRSKAFTALNAFEPLAKWECEQADKQGIEYETAEVL